MSACPFFELLNQAGLNCPIDFELGMMIHDTFKYNIDIVATL